LLNNALAQSGWSGEKLQPSNWRQVIWDRLSEFEWEKAVADVKPFLIDAEGANLLTRDNIRSLLLS
jgi:hypothetical protein